MYEAMYLALLFVAACGAGMFVQAVVEEGHFRSAIVIYAILLIFLASQISPLVVEIFEWLGIMQSFSSPVRRFFGSILASVPILLIVVGAMILSATPTDLIDPRSRAEIARARRKDLLAQKPRRGTYRRRNHFVEHTNR